MKKIVFSDLDGTLVRDSEIISSKDQSMIHDFRKKGNLFIFCTGRNIQQVQRFSKMFEWDYMILNNGGLILDSKGNILFHEQMDNKDIKMIIQKYLIRYPYMHCSFFDGKKSYAYQKGRCMVFEEKDYIPYDMDFMEVLKRYKLGFDTICFYNPSGSLDEVKEIQEFLEDKVKGIHGILNCHYLDVVPKNVSKGNGIQKLLSVLNDPYETYGIGDSYNDILMFHNVDHPYTFIHAEESVKKFTAGQVRYVYELLQNL
ncbi:MAG: HAD family hydrolase [Bacillota bacterium]|nr:HAD family hydrolase [Bacillota bacterium]